MSSLKPSFTLASSNQGKIDELQSLLPLFELLKPPETLDVIEDGADFQQNSFIKAKAYYDRFKNCALADDSGLVLEARPDLLGVHSARFKPELSYPEKCLDICELLTENREAAFVCYLCFYVSPEKIYFFEGRVSGKIANAPKGEGGFGYDSIFIPSGFESTFAQDPSLKVSCSHRAKACQQAVSFFESSIAKEGFFS